MMKIKKIASIVTLCSILTTGAATFAPQSVDAAPHHGPRIERRMPPRHMPPPPRRIEHRPPRHVRGHYPTPPPRHHHSKRDRAAVAGLLIGAIIGAVAANNG